ncbi:nidogen-1-like [Danio aesculapii]|uniref:nidogen-1-like n=1 Tax=Danio aesculapii TaxID=1142201 RepID=UPI0024BF9E44|nr:nidogen-1-like [Danio aesculapii]
MIVFVCSVGLALLVSVQCLTREQLFDYGTQFGDQILDSGPDSVHELELEQTLHFFKGKFDKVYVSTNGFISVAEPSAESDYLGKMPAKFGMIAAFLGDLDTGDGDGKVFFRQDKSPLIVPSEDEIEPTHVIIATWENVTPQTERGRGDELEFTQRNTFQLVIANMELKSYAILLYPEEGMQFGSTLIADEDQPVLVGFNEGLVTGWFVWSKTQGNYYRITEDNEEAVDALALETNSGQPGIWVYEIGMSPGFTDIKPGQVKEVTEVTEVTVIDTPAPEPSVSITTHHKHLPVVDILLLNCGHPIMRISRRLKRRMKRSRPVLVVIIW